MKRYYFDNKENLFRQEDSTAFNEAAVLVQAALQNGGVDNITCIVLEVLPATDYKVTD